MNLNQSNVFNVIVINILFTILLIKTKIKIFLLFLPIGYNNYYSINNSDLLVCGNKSENAVNFNWFVGENGLFKNISKFTNEISVRCPAVYFCEYDILLSNLNYGLHRMELFIVNCPILKEDAIQERSQLLDATERILNKFHITTFTYCLLSLLFY